MNNKWITPLSIVITILIVIASLYQLLPMLIAVMGAPLYLIVLLLALLLMCYLIYRAVKWILTVTIK